MKPLVINEEAAEELEGAIEYYERKKRGLGFDLANKVSDAFQRIQLNSDSIPITIRLAFESTSSRDFRTPSSTLSSMTTLRSLLLLTRSDAPITGDSVSPIELRRF